MPRRVMLLLCLLVALAPATAVAQDSPFTPLPPAQTVQPEPDTPPVTSTNSSDDGGLKGWQEILIFGAGGILLAGIAWAIVSDARSAAPTEETEGQHDAKAHREAEHKRRRQQARAANRRARAARRRNR
jgi:hypothetical protein